MSFVGGFVLAVVLHALWDGQSSLVGTAVVAVSASACSPSPRTGPRGPPSLRRWRPVPDDLPHELPDELPDERGRRPPGQLGRPARAPDAPAPGARRARRRRPALPLPDRPLGAAGPRRASRPAARHADRGPRPRRGPAGPGPPPGQATFATLRDRTGRSSCSSTPPRIPRCTGRWTTWTAATGWGRGHGDDHPTGRAVGGRGVARPAGQVAREPPDKHRGLTDVETRYRQRYPTWRSTSVTREIFRSGTPPSGRCASTSPPSASPRSRARCCRASRAGRPRGRS